MGGDGGRGGDGGDAGQITVTYCQMLADPSTIFSSYGGSGGAGGAAGSGGTPSNGGCFWGCGSSWPTVDGNQGARGNDGKKRIPITVHDPALCLPKPNDEQKGVRAHGR